MTHETASAATQPTSLASTPLTSWFTADSDSGVRELIWLYPKDYDEQLSANFHLREFHCHCTHRGCPVTLIHPRLVESLQTIREIVARPLWISSGFRCKGYNRIVGGRPRSQHTMGMAVDLVCRDLEELDELAGVASRIPAIGAIGIYPVRGYIHLDVRRATGNGPTRWSG